MSLSPCEDAIAAGACEHDLKERQEKTDDFSRAIFSNEDGGFCRGQKLPAGKNEVVSGLTKFNLRVDIGYVRSLPR